MVKRDIHFIFIEDNEGNNWQETFLYMNQPNLMPLLTFFSIQACKKFHWNDHNEVDLSTFQKKWSYVLW